MRIEDDYVVGFTQKGEPFYIDKEDFSKVKDYCWWFRKEYLQGKDNGKRILLHRLIMNCPDDKVVDHINHNTADNRKSNLRIVSRSQNSMNRVKRKDNRSGVTGVYFSEKEQCWAASITKEQKTVTLGFYQNFDMAVKARKNAEEKIFQEYSYDNSIKYSENNKIGESNNAE